MRLIDADELGIGFEECLKCIFCVNPMHTDRGCDGDCMISNERLLKAVEKYICDTIKAQKTVDVVPVKCEKRIDDNYIWEHFFDDYEDGVL